MRVIVLGGTWFVGRAISETLVRAGHQVLVAHRGQREPEGLPEVAHLHGERESWPQHRAELAAFRPDAAIDVSAGNGAGARAALAALPPGLRLIVISSVDVYRAFEGFRADRQTDPLPLTERSPLRTSRFLEGPDWENLEIEETYLPVGATILRLGAVYGEHDYQHRFEPVLRRIRAGRTRIPVGSGGFLFSRVYAGDVARAVLAALDTPHAAGECFNIVEPQTAAMRLFYEQLVAASGTDTELVRVPDHALPPDLWETGPVDQHLLASPQKAADLLGWHATADDETLRRCVRWHLDHPPADTDNDFFADDRALVSG